MDVALFMCSAVVEVAAWSVVIADGMKHVSGKLASILDVSCACCYQHEPACLHRASA